MEEKISDLISLEHFICHFYFILLALFRLVQVALLIPHDAPPPPNFAFKKVCKLYSLIVDLDNLSNI